jgi:prefoldin beta subunit
MDSQKQQQVMQELQVLEHNMSNLLMQKQAFQLELSETKNAIEELKKTQDSVYKVVGSLMVKADKEKTLKELEEKQKLLSLRNESIDKQEKLFEKRAKELQEELRAQINSESKETKD